MEIYQYLNSVLPKKYKITPLKYEQIMPVEYAFRSDKNKFKPVKLSGEMAYVYTYVSGTDTVIIPERLKHASLYDIRIQVIDYWIRNNVFNYMYTHTNPLDIKTTDVRLRIAFGQINKLQSLSSDSKLYWIEWLCELYRIRLKATMDYYLTHVVKLPF